MGAFISQEDIFHHSPDVELKWAEHKKGEKRSDWNRDDSTHTVSILVKGHFKIIFEETSYELMNPGDYVAWKPGTTHSWSAICDSTIITVRWPSNGES